MNQKTISRAISFQGIGLHSGKEVHVRFLPAGENSGIRFVRTDLAQQIEIPALADHVGDTSRSTSVRDQATGASVGTIEHLMAALAARGITNLRIETEGEEFPILDGCSKQLLSYLDEAGVQEQQCSCKTLVLNEPICYENGQGTVLRAYPSEHFEIEVTVDYRTRILGRQTAVLRDVNEVEHEFACCRTFCFLHEIWPLIQHNLARGGSLDNAIVYVAQPIREEEQRKIAEFFHVENVCVDEHTGILSTTRLQFDNEAARHKLLDVFGDLQLVGIPVQARIVAECPGHTANTRLSQLLFQYMQEHPEQIR